MGAPRSAKLTSFDRSKWSGNWLILSDTVDDSNSSDRDEVNVSLAEDYIVYEGVLPRPNDDKSSSFKENWYGVPSR